MVDQFRECPACAAKPGSPALCEICLHNRGLEQERDELVLRLAKSKETVIQAVNRNIRVTGERDKACRERDGALALSKTIVNEAHEAVQKLTRERDEASTSFQQAADMRQQAVDDCEQIVEAMGLSLRSTTGECIDRARTIGKLHVAQAANSEIRSAYMVIETESSFCPRCDSTVRLLHTDVHGPRFYLCPKNGCGFIGEIGVGPVSQDCDSGYGIGETPTKLQRIMKILEQTEDDLVTDFEAEIDRIRQVCGD